MGEHEKPLYVAAAEGVLIGLGIVAVFAVAILAFGAIGVLIAMLLPATAIVAHDRIKRARLRPTPSAPALREVR